MTASTASLPVPAAAGTLAAASAVFAATPATVRSQPCSFLTDEAFADDDARWTALRARDARADGHFFYSVRTTGVYCRPSCPSRPARPENIAFHATVAAAERAGFRACLRCRPAQPPLAQQQAAAIARACRLIEASDPAPDLATLARGADLSAHHFHRVFRSIVGVTPRAYAQACREARVRERLAAGCAVTEALYAAGYQSAGPFYAQAAGALGMKPAVYRRGGPGTTIRFALADCSLGAVLVAATAQGVCAVSLGDDPQALLVEFQDRFPQAELVGGDPGFEALVARVLAVLEAPGATAAEAAALPLDIRGTAFQQRVWRALRDIAPGRTVSYTDVAEALGVPRAVRAVASACAANTLAVLIPCHRVVRRDGSLSGYRWGLQRKRALLDSEAASAGAGAASTADTAR